MYQEVSVRERLPDVAGKYIVRTITHALKSENVFQTRMFVSTDEKGKVSKVFDVTRQTVTHWFEKI